MSYKNSSRFYRIPVLGYGDTITEEEEMKKASIIDNLLFASNFGTSKCILEEGDYAVKSESGGCYYLEITKPENGDYSLLGIVNYRLFLSDKTEKSNVVTKGYTYNVYVEYISSTEYDASAFNIKAYCGYPPEDNEYRLLIAQIDLTDEKDIKLNTDTGKVYAKNILAHTSDFTNPHGKKLLQDELYIQNHRVYTSIYGKMNVFPNQENKYICPDGFIPVFANIYPENPNMGTIAWKIYNDDVLIYVSGLSNGTVNIKVEGYYKK